jgi:Flp pilus assembly protein TadD
MRTLAIAFALFVSFTTATAQTIEQAKNFIFNERYISAKDVLQKILTKTSDQEEALYWMGMTMILPDDRSAQDLMNAKKFYQSKLGVPANPLIMVGIAHIELLEGNTGDARKYFDQAISVYKGKEKLVLTAIGFANAHPDNKNGDPNYAIQKLDSVTQMKKFNDPDVYVSIGDAYRKLGDGGKAIKAYQSALNLNPKYARPDFRIGKLYQSQGRGQESIFMEYYNNAIANDPGFAPVYANLFSYYYETDVTKAAEYFEKWQSNADEDYKSCYYRAALKYAQGFFMDAISKSDECIKAAGDNPYANLFGLKANAYNRLKDSIRAVENFEKYFEKQLPEKITNGDYLEYAKNLLKIPGNEQKAGSVIDKAVALDSMETNKLILLKLMVQAYESRKLFKDAADWGTKIVQVKKSPSKFDLNTVGFNYFKAGAYPEAAAAFTFSTTKFSDDPYAYNMIGKSNWAIDTTMELGLANPAFEKTIQLSLVDSLKYKPQLINAYKYFVAYHANVKKDNKMALEFTNKILAIEPNDAEAKVYLEALSTSSKPKQPGKKP